MDPLSQHLLAAAKREAACTTRRFGELEQALNEMGYWLLMRPRNTPLGKMPPCGISEECRYLEEFPSHHDSVAGCTAFDTVIEVYEDERVADV